MKKNKLMNVSIGVLIITTLILVGFTYAYYRTRIIGNGAEKSVSVTSKKLEIEYIDGDSYLSISGNIRPGFYATKTFSVENTGDDTVNYSIKLDNITNTFSRINDWTFSLKYNDEVIKEGTLPNSESYLKNVISIAPDEVQTYTLTINYLTLDENQSIDMGKTVSFRVNIANETGEIFENVADNTLLAAINRDNVITEPLTNPGMFPSGVNGYLEKEIDNSVKTFSTENDLNKYYAYSSQYTFNKNTGKYTLVNPKVVKYADVYTELKDSYVTYIDGYAHTYINTSNLSNIYKVTVADNTGFKYTTLQSEAKTISEASFSVTEDDDGKSYYYRGNVKNNFITYNGMCWRIVRVQGDGSIKLVLADEKHTCSSGYSLTNNTSAFITNSSNSLIKIGNYLNYGGYGTSTLVPNALSDWATKVGLSKYIHGGYTQYNSLNNEWCEDMSVYLKEASSMDEYMTDYYYSAYDRLINKFNPTLKCKNKDKGFDNTTANIIEQPIGILTADEVVFAGLAYQVQNSNSYLLSNAVGSYWTLTPMNYIFEWADPNIFIVSATTNFVYLNSSPAGAYYENYVRPAIVISNSIIKDGGNGTLEAPYIVE